MKIINITGSKSNVGKTTLAANIISWLNESAAIKCTLPHKKGPVETIVTEEREIIAQSGTDTELFLKAGADPVVWISTNAENLNCSLKRALNKVQSSSWLVIEGNRAMQVVKGCLTLFITSLYGEMKPSAYFALNQADIIILNIKADEINNKYDITQRKNMLRSYNDHAQLIEMNLGKNNKKEWEKLMNIFYGLLGGINNMDKELLKEKIKDNLIDGKLSCAVAHQIAQEMNVELKEIGRLADEMNIKINHCQLGIF